MFVCVSVCLCGTLPLDDRELTEQFHEGDDSSGVEDFMYCEQCPREENNVLVRDLLLGPLPPPFSNTSRICR